jgi:hypothetical protein
MHADQEMFRKKQLTTLRASILDEFVPITIIIQTTILVASVTSDF